MCVRIAESFMPPTINTLESFNGHLNRVTPRRNTFWDSLHRLVEMIMRKRENL
jgi:hypothetical protein